MFDNVKIHEAENWWVIGDVHGCFDELVELIKKIPSEHKIAFVGDFVDRGPNSRKVISFVSDLLHIGRAIAVSGNHDDKFARYLRGNPVNQNNGLKVTVEEYNSTHFMIQEQIRQFVESLPYYAVLRDASGMTTIVTHAAIEPWMIGVNNGKVRSLCLYGQTTGEKNEDGYPVRLNDWCSSWTLPDVQVVYGHTPVREVAQIGQTFNVDTGCVFGGKLTAFSTSTREVISVDAIETYHEKRGW